MLIDVQTCKVTGRLNEHVVGCTVDSLLSGHGWDHQICPFKGLVTNYGEGGATKREGGAREVLPLRKGGRKKFKPC